MRHSHCAMVALGGLLLIVSFSTGAPGAGINEYAQTNLTSDGGPNVPSAPNIDPNLQNPWGIAFSNTSPFWLADQNSGKSTLYNGAGVQNGPPSPVTIPSSSGTPTGVVNNGTAGAFPVGNGGNGLAANFIFDTLTGNIVGWNNASGAISQASVSGASFTGLALANSQLYAADNATGSGHSTIDVFNSSYGTGTAPGGFVDTNLPPGARPYNIQAFTINGVVTLVVTYQATGGVGAVDYFDVNGNPLGHLTTNPALANPWGLALAPATFGAFGGDLLVANRNGQINAFDPTSLTYLGTLDNALGQPLIIPGGLWGLAFRSATSGFDPNILYFATGINGTGNFYSDGLFGEITAIPEPSSAILLGLGMILLCGVCTWRTWQRRLQTVPILAGGDAPR